MYFPGSSGRNDVDIEQLIENNTAIEAEHDHWLALVKLLNLYDH